MSFVKNGLLLLVSLIVVVILGEFVVRIAFDGITSTASLQSWFGSRWKESIKLNSLGYRDKEFDIEKPEGKYRIVVIGDSFAFGQGLPVEDRFSNIIEQKLNKHGQQYEVLNISRPGQGTADELAVLKEVVLPLSPDFIIVQWLPNDFRDGVHVWRTSELPRLIANPALHKKLYRKSALYFVLNNQWLNLRPLFGGEIFDSGEAMMLPFMNPGSEEEQLTIQPMVELLSTLNDSGKDFAVILHPLLLPGMAREYQMQPMHDAVIQRCENVGARCLDLTPIFVALGQDYDFKELGVNRFDMHPGSDANRMAAEYLLQQLGPEFWDYRPD
jgi:lysophospholipase L1-like esterase